MSGLASIIWRYEEFRMPECPGAMLLDPRWVDSFIEDCRNSEQAVYMIICFDKRGRRMSEGSGRIWAQQPAKDWPNFMEHCLDAAKEKLERLLRLEPEVGWQRFVVLYAADQINWKDAQEEGRQSVRLYDPDELIARIRGGQIQIGGALTEQGVEELRGNWDPLAQAFAENPVNPARVVIHVIWITVLLLFLLWRWLGV